MSANDIYIIELPGKEPREVTNINFLKVSELVEKAGGRIYLKPIEKTPLPPVNPLPSQGFFFTATKPIVYENTTYKSYDWSDAVKIANEIREKHFAKYDKVKTCRIFPMRRKTKRILGQACYRENCIRLSDMLLSGKYSYALQQVIYHEFAHIACPGEVHNGPNFRRMERNNPYRTKRTNRLTSIS